MILITICARGGSKGIPNKNIKHLAGKPLIYYTIEMAHRFCDLYDAKVSLSTDNENIIEIAAKFNLHTDYSRPKELASDSAGKIPAIKDLLIYEEKNTQNRIEYILDLDITSPIRTIDDLSKAFEIIKAHPNALNLFSVNKARKNPYFNMVEMKDSGFVKLVKDSDKQVLSRQTAPQVFELNASFYIYTRKYFEFDKIPLVTHSTLIYLMPGICFDLDEIVDFEFLEYLVANNIIQLL